MNGNLGYRRFPLLLLIGALAVQMPAVAQYQGDVVFGDQVVGTTSAGQFLPNCCSNPGSQLLPPFRISLTGDFLRGPRTTCAFGEILGPGESCVFEVLFAPTQVGLRTGTATYSCTG